jgi:Pyruvate/2-oxoacid:ferredoxin oxidoreductase gamma subunit
VFFYGNGGQNMSPQTNVYLSLVMSVALGVLSGCANQEVQEDPSLLSSHMIRHTLREEAELDTPKLISLMNREFATDSNNDQVYFRRASVVLGQTVLVQPSFAERQNSIKEFKSKFEQSEFLDLLPQTAEQLISITESNNAADQASALFALTNLVVEIRAVYKGEKEFKEDLHALLIRVRDANLKVSEKARRYAHEQIANLVSPSDEARAVLKILDGEKS